ncbi:LOW QUALITY PROTEIN: UPF0764 protein C16orf89, partial [Plecturocebus cupreus]
MISAHCNLCLLSSGSYSVMQARMKWHNPGSLQPPLPSLLNSWNHRHKPPCLANFYIFKTRFCHIGQTGLEHLASSDPPALASQIAGITGMGHCPLP